MVPEGLERVLVMGGGPCGGWEGLRRCCGAYGWTGGVLWGLGGFSGVKDSSGSWGGGDLCGAVGGGLSSWLSAPPHPETEAKALLKERQKKDNHNLSETGGCQ